MKVIVAGGRDFVGTKDDEEWLKKQLVDLGATHVVCGMAKGADQFGLLVATQMSLPILKFPAKWGQYGKSAGYKRNYEMATHSNACILFPGGKGTEHMHDIAVQFDLKVIRREG